MFTNKETKDAMLKNLKEAMEKKANEPEKTEKTDLRVSSGDNIIPLSEKITIKSFRSDDWFDEYINWENDLDKNEIVELVLKEVSKDVKKAIQNLKEELKGNLKGWIHGDNPPFYIDEDNINEVVEEIDKVFEKHIGDLK